MKILLITSSIIPIANDVKLINIKDRLYQTFHAIDKIKELNIFEQIYLCDGSGYKIDSNHDFEYLYFEQDKAVVSIYGKSFGELLIYEHFFQNVQINDNVSIYKISARWMIENLSSIINKNSKYNNIFYTFYPYGLLRDYVHTSFFITEIWRLKEIVKKSKNIILNNPFTVLEKAFAISLMDYKRHWIKSSYPIYNCISGTHNRNVKKTVFEFGMKNIMAGLAMYSFTVK
jgi:hypothetical protein